MNCNSITNRPRRGHRSAFTLVELLVVIVVIGLLISILVPAVNQVRLSARETTTKGTLGTLQTALETYKSDGRVGGGYPPSQSDDPNSPQGANYPGAGARVASPYQNQGLSTNPIGISGAGLLVWALAGADLLGCPGFRTFRTGSSLWSQDTDDQGTTTVFGAYYLDPDTLLPKHPRSGRFVDVDKINITRWNPNAASGAGSFEIPAEVEAQKDMGQPVVSREYPMFLDSFGFPILYWRADPAGVEMYDGDPAIHGNPQQRGFYHWYDNGHLIDWRRTGTVLVLRPGNDKHRMEFLPPKKMLEGEWYKLGSFPRYIRNLDVTARMEPHNADTYLLVSPGADGLYGTADDIANFEHNGTDDTDRD